MDDSSGIWILWMASCVAAFFLGIGFCDTYSISGSYDRTEIRVNYQITDKEIKSGNELIIIDLSGSNPVLREGE